MNNGRFYKIVIVLLLLLNGGTLAFLWMKSEKEDHQMGGRPTHGGPNPVDRMMSEKLQFTEAQEKLMRRLKDEHHGQMMDIQKEETQLHTELFNLLKNNNIDTAAKNAVMQKLADNDRRKEEVTFEHFKKIRLILTPEQLPMFDDLMEEISSHIMAPHMRGGPGGMPPPPPGGMPPPGE